VRVARLERDKLKYYGWAKDALWWQSRSGFVLVLAAVAASLLSLVLLAQAEKRLTP